MSNTSLTFISFNAFYQKKPGSHLVAIVFLYTGLTY